MKNKKINYLILSISFLLSLFLQIISYNKYISPGIDGENIVAAYYLIPIHTPGYPLYSIIGKLFVLLPISNIGFKVVLMSSFFIALSLVLLCIIISKLFFLDTAGYFDAISCVITMSLFTFSPTFLLHGITASIYPMFAFLILIIYFLALEINYHLRMNFNILLLLCFLSGIILSFYPSIWFQIFIPVFVFMNFKKYYNFFNFCKFILLFLLGFSISLFLPFRTTEKEILILSYASSFKDFLKIFFKTEFFSYIKIFSFSEYFLTLLFFIYHLIRQATVFLIIFAIIGFFILIKVNKEITMLLVSISVFNTIIFAFLFKVPVEDYIYGKNMDSIISYIFYFSWIWNSEDLAKQTFDKKKYYLNYHFNIIF